QAGRPPSRSRQLRSSRCQLHWPVIVVPGSAPRGRSASFIRVAFASTAASPAGVHRLATAIFCFFDPTVGQCVRPVLLGNCSLVRCTRHRRQGSAPGWLGVRGNRSCLIAMQLYNERPTAGFRRAGWPDGATAPPASDWP
ncbi:unnamed protein product, partial [Phaeothamnion confervicola]